MSSAPFEYLTEENRVLREQIGDRRLRDGILKTNRYLIHDRDPLYTAQFLGILAESGVKSVKLPPRSPTLNAFDERWKAPGFKPGAFVLKQQGAAYRLT